MSLDDDDLDTLNGCLHRPISRRNEGAAFRAETKQRTKKIVVGARSDVYCGCHPQKELFVGRVSKAYHEQHVRNMTNASNVEILEIRQISLVDAPMTSYKLTAWHDAEDKLLQQTSWPKFITCRRWVRPRRHRDDNTHGNPPKDWGNL